jgi:Galactose oxidase, central domain
MTSQHELNRLLDAFFVEGTNELADRVIDAALEEIDDTQQRRVTRMPRRFSTMTMPFRLAAAAVIGVIAVGTIYLVGRGPTGPAGPSRSPAVTTGASQTAGPSVLPSTRLPGSWTITGALHSPHSGHAAVRLTDGRVLVVGAYRGDHPEDAEIYDPGSRSWTATGSLNGAGRGQPTATLLADGRVLVVGDYNDVANAKVAEVYDPATGKWTFSRELKYGRIDHTATLLLDGRVLVTGGATGPGGKSAELYDPATGSWISTGDMISHRVFHSATLLPDGTVFVVGGYGEDNENSYESAELFDPRTGVWTAIDSPMAAIKRDPGHAEHSAVLLPDGRVLVVGAYSLTDDVLAELYDPRTRTWTATGPMLADGTRWTATLLPNGMVLVAGGQANVETPGSPDPAIAVAQLYDPAINTWTEAAHLNLARRYHAATLLLDGTVLVTGGIGNPDPALSAEIFDPAGG